MRFLILGFLAEAFNSKITRRSISAFKFASEETKVRGNKKKEQERIEERQKEETRTQEKQRKTLTKVRGHEGAKKQKKEHVQ